MSAAVRRPLTSEAMKLGHVFPLMIQCRLSGLHGSEYSASGRRRCPSVVIEPVTLPEDRMLLAITT
jgi:hypothetical protein